MPMLLCLLLLARLLLLQRSAQCPGPCLGPADFVGHTGGYQNSMKQAAGINQQPLLLQQRRLPLC
jgi:hypothetical protein